MKDDILVGVDIGGSHVGIGFVDEYGRVVDEGHANIENSKDVSAEQVIEVVVNVIRSLQLGHAQTNSGKNCTIKAIGVGCPGLIRDNTLIAASNFPNLKNIRLADEIAKRLSNGTNLIPAYLLNDADAAVSAEVWGNQSKYSSYKNIVMLTLGTGIGCGLILNNRLHQGSFGAIEAGHLIITSSNISDDSNKSHDRSCGCGQRGCVEAYASARNTAIRLQELDVISAASSSSSSKSKRSADVGSEHVLPNAKDVFSRYASHDANAVRVVEETAEYLALLCINICRVVDPDIIVFGGGMANAGETLIPLIHKYIQLRTWTVLPTDVRLAVVSSSSSGHIGVIGAALAADRFLQEKTQSNQIEQLMNQQKASVPPVSSTQRNEAIEKVGAPSNTTSAFFVTAASLGLLTLGSRIQTSDKLTYRLCGGLLVGQLIYGISLFF